MPYIRKLQWIDLKICHNKCKYVLSLNPINPNRGEGNQKDRVWDYNHIFGKRKTFFNHVFSQTTKIKSGSRLQCFQKPLCIRLAFNLFLRLGTCKNTKQGKTNWDTLIKLFYKSRNLQYYSLNKIIKTSNLRLTIKECISNKKILLKRIIIQN